MSIVCLFEFETLNIILNQDATKKKVIYIS